MFRRNAKKDSCGSLGMAPPLLPILKRSDAYSKQSRKLGLRQSVFLSNCGHVRGLKGYLPRWFSVPSENGTAFLYAFYEFAKELVSHLNSSFTRAVNTFLCSAERSSRSFFPYIKSIKTTSSFEAQ